MARFRFTNRITANSQNMEIRALQQQMQDLVSALNITLNDLNAENIAPEFLSRIENVEQGEIQVIKNKEANVYMGTDGALFKILE